MRKKLKTSICPNLLKTDLLQNRFTKAGCPMILNTKSMRLYVRNSSQQGIISPKMQRPVGKVFIKISAGKATGYKTEISKVSPTIPLLKLPRFQEAGSSVPGLYF
jgi:hypothetical protein